MYACMYVCIVCMYFMYVCKYVYMYVCMYVCIMWVSPTFPEEGILPSCQCMYVCMYVHVCMFMQCGYHLFFLKRENCHPVNN